VDGCRDQRSGKSELLPELADYLDATVRIAWDSDITHKPEVLAASKYLAHQIAISGGNPLMTFIPPELDGSKNGADDFVHRHGIEAYQVLRKYARPAGEIQRKDGQPVGLKWTWSPEPSGDEASHSKAMIAWSVLKDEMVMLPLGLHRWTGTHWQRQGGKPREEVGATLHAWMDKADWRKRNSTAFTSVVSELLDRLRAPAVVLWDPGHLMAFSNGTLDTRTNTFTPGHRRSDRLTQCLPYQFDPAATCPNWLAFLKEASRGDPFLIQVLQAAMRWVMEPKDNFDYPIEVGVDLKGTKGRGKGAAASGFVTICGGSDFVGAFKSKSFGDPNALMQMQNKRCCIDFDASGFIPDSGIFNSIMSNEEVPVKTLYKDQTKARLNTVLVRCMNDLPGQAAAGSEGADRRLITLPFDVAPKTRDPHLKAKIRSEAAGLFQWAWSLSMDEAAAILRNASKSIRIRDEQVKGALARNEVLSFLVDKFETGHVMKEASDLFADYLDWAKETNRQNKGLTSTWFGNEMKKLVDSGTEGSPLRDESGNCFRKRRTPAGRYAYDIPEMGSWDFAGFLLPGMQDKEPGGPQEISTDGGTTTTPPQGAEQRHPEQWRPTLRNSSGREPSPGLGSEQSEQSEHFFESFTKEEEGGHPLHREFQSSKTLQTVQTIQTDCAARDLGLKTSEDPEGLPEQLRPNPSDPAALGADVVVGAPGGNGTTPTSNTSNGMSSTNQATPATDHGFGQQLDGWIAANGNGQAPHQGQPGSAPPSPATPATDHGFGPQLDAAIDALKAQAENGHQEDA
jgi:phage/plasmid-associated DNA primase